VPLSGWELDWCVQQVELEHGPRALSHAARQMRAAQQVRDVEATLVWKSIFLRLRREGERRAGRGTGGGAEPNGA